MCLEVPGADTGVVDGTEGPPSNLYTQKQYEVQKHVALTYHTISNYVVVVNKKFWDGLPADIRTTLDGAMKDASKFNDQVSAKDEAAAIAVHHQGFRQVDDLYTHRCREGGVVKAMLPGRTKWRRVSARTPSPRDSGRDGRRQVIWRVRPGREPRRAVALRSAREGTVRFLDRFEETFISF
jgi:hypothetical protein